MATSRTSAVRAVRKYADGGKFYSAGASAGAGIAGTANPAEKSFFDRSYKTRAILSNNSKGTVNPNFGKTDSSFNPTGLAPTYNLANGTPKFNLGSPNLRAAAADAKTPGGGINWSNRLANTADKLAPYASNIANAFTSPAAPQLGAMMTAPKLVAPNFDATRADMNASESAFGRSADQSLDANSAAIAKLGARAQTLGSMNKLAEGEANAKGAVANEQAKLSAQTDYANTSTINQYKNDLTTYANVAKSAKSANLANAADKYIAGKNVKAQGDLDLKKAALIGSMYDPGVEKRTSAKAAALWAASTGKKPEEFAKGGMLDQIDATTMMLGRKLKNGGRLAKYTK
jgi:hypothetical protein